SRRKILFLRRFEAESGEDVIAASLWRSAREVDAKIRVNARAEKTDNRGPHEEVVEAIFLPGAWGDGVPVAVRVGAAGSRADLHGGVAARLSSCERRPIGGRAPADPIQGQATQRERDDSATARQPTRAPHAP